MSKICYEPKQFEKRNLKLINQANTILEEYTKQGFVLTLRQLYYQFVASGWLPNTVNSYKRLGQVIGDARLAGLVDWEMLEDRTRNLSDRLKFLGPQDALDRLTEWYHIDLWEGQEFRPEVWIEKDALSGVIERVCKENDVPYFSCRGYTSLSEMWRASLRLREHLDNNQTPYIIHFGDHDPSGIDMSRDIVDRLQKTFMADLSFERVALNMDQIEEYKPPPNPAKVRDSRYQAYYDKFGDESWELDALQPRKFTELIEIELKKIRDDAKFQERVKEKEEVKERLLELSQEWEMIPEMKETLETSTRKIAKLGKDYAQAVKDAVDARATSDREIRQLKEQIKKLKGKKA